ncbi:hypothetical protein ACN47E_000477 [Coniothyrium glycines]
MPVTRYEKEPVFAPPAKRPELATSTELPASSNDHPVATFPTPSSKLGLMVPTTGTTTGGEEEDAAGEVLLEDSTGLAVMLGLEEASEDEEVARSEEEAEEISVVDTTIDDIEGVGQGPSNRLYVHTDVPASKEIVRHEPETIAIVSHIPEQAPAWLTDALIIVEEQVGEAVAVAVSVVVEGTIIDEESDDSDADAKVVEDTATDDEDD